MPADLEFATRPLPRNDEAVLRHGCAGHPGAAPIRRTRDVTTSAAGSAYRSCRSSPAVLGVIRVLIADEDYNRLLLVDPHGRIRWQFPQTGDLPRGYIFGPPDDAFISPGRPPDRRHAGDV